MLLHILIISLGCLTSSDAAKDKNHDIFMNDDDVNDIFPNSCLDCLPRLTCSLFADDFSYQQQDGEESEGWENSTTKLFLSQMVKHGLANQQEVDALPGNLGKRLNDSCRLNVAQRLVSFWFNVPFVQVQGNFCLFIIK